jgi:hypothetical protein
MNQTPFPPLIDSLGDLLNDYREIAAQGGYAWLKFAAMIAEEQGV